MKILGRLPIFDKMKQELSCRGWRSTRAAAWGVDAVHLLQSDDEQLPLTVLLPSSDGEDNEVLDSTTGSLTLDCQVELRSPIPNRATANPEEKGSTEAAACSLNVEEFECGVTSGNVGTDKQEWSFTLYDFDGRGKVTKEDLATLMKSLYEVVGSSLKLQGQQRGNANKSFKLRLTMAPESSSGSACDPETPATSCCADQPLGSQTGVQTDSTAHLHQLQQQSASAIHPGRKKRQQHDDLNLQRKRSSPPTGGSLPLLQASDTGSTPSPQGAASAQQAPSSRSTRSRGERRFHREPSSRSSTRPHSSRQSHTRSSIDPSPDTDVYHYPTATPAPTTAVLPRPTASNGLIAAASENSPSERYRHVIRNAAVDYPLRHYGDGAASGLGGPPSPRHSKRQSHRRNRDLAMQHVAEWLQREPLQVWTGVGREGTCGAEDGPSPDDIPPRVVIHEHRHVHEHHHHYYYHHYHDT